MSEQDDGYTKATLERIVKDMDDLRHQVRNPQPPYVTQEVHALSRQAQGERIGALEADVAILRTELRTEIKDIKGTFSRVNGLAWTAIVLPILVAVIVMVIRTAVE